MCGWLMACRITGSEAPNGNSDGRHPGQVLAGERDHGHDRLIVRAGCRYSVHHAGDRLVIAYHGAKTLPAQHLLVVHRNAPRRLGPDLSWCGQQQRGSGVVVLEEVIDVLSVGRVFGQGCGQEH